MTLRMTLKDMILPVAVLVGGASAAAAARPIDDGPASLPTQPVVCQVQALTLCQGGYCSAFFDQSSEVAYFFDFAHRTYINPGLGPQTRPMQDVRVAQAGDVQKITFVMRMPRGAANVTFDASKPQVGPVKMTAASVYAYPTQPRIVAIDGMRCAS